MKKIRIIGAIIIVLATIISVILSNLPQKHETGLFGVAQIFAPLLIGAISLIVFIALSFLLKNKPSIWFVIISTSAYIIYVGLDLYFKF